MRTCRTMQHALYKARSTSDTLFMLIKYKREIVSRGGGSGGASQGEAWECQVKRKGATRKRFRVQEKATNQVEVKARWAQ